MNDVKQAGFAQVQSSQEIARPSHKEDSTGTAFSSLMRSGEKSLRQTAVISTDAQQRDGGSPRLVPNAMSHAWHAPIKVDIELTPEAADSDEHPGAGSAAHARQKPKASAEVQESRGVEGKRAEDDKPEQPGVMVPAAIVTFLANKKLEIGSDAQSTDPTSNPAGNILAAAGGGAGSSLKKTMPGNHQLPDAARKETPVSADAGDAVRGGKTSNHKAADSSNFHPQSTLHPQSTPEAGQQQSSDTRIGTPPEAMRPAVKEAARDAQQAEPPSASSKVGVVSMQTLPAPASSATTTAAFVDAISADPVWKASASEAAAHLSLHDRPQPGAVQSLKIQLRPAELGVVTADLRFAGEQLSVELKVENAEAYHRLSSDTDAIVKAFRALGYEIDQIAIQQTQPNSQTPRTDSGAIGSGGLSRDFQSGFSSDSGGEGERFGNQGRNMEGRMDGRHSDRSGAISRDGTSRGLYI
jgi:chemotaxis protein MotD